MKNRKPQKAEEIELFQQKFGKRALLLKSFGLNPTPEGGYIIFELNPNPIIIIFALTEDKKVIAVLQFRFAAKEKMIEVPGGLFDGKESPQEVARRELLEETGYISDDITSLAPLPIWFEPASVRTPFLPYLARNCRRVRHWQAQDGEHCEVRTFSLDDWVTFIKEGKILDAKTIVATFLALQYLHV